MQIWSRQNAETFLFLFRFSAVQWLPFFHYEQVVATWSILTFIIIKFKRSWKPKLGNKVMIQLMMATYQICSDIMISTNLWWKAFPTQPVVTYEIYKKMQIWVFEIFAILFIATSPHGLVVWFLLWVQEVRGSNPRADLLFCLSNPFHIVWPNSSTMYCLRRSLQPYSTPFCS